MDQQEMIFHMPHRNARLLVLIAFFALSTVIAFCQPKLRVIGGFKFDYGTVYSNRTLKKEIMLKNDGTDTLIITSPSSSCGCTVAMISESQSHIPPDSTGRMSVSFDPSRFSGSVTKGISFETNDPKQAHAHIDFTVKVSKAIEISAEYLPFPDAKVDSVSEAEYILKNVTDKPMKILSILAKSNADTVESKSCIVTAEIDKKVIEPNDFATIKFSLRPTKKGISKGNIVIDTDSPDVPRISTRFFSLAKAKTQ
jgi:hypothetical protein